MSESYQVEAVLDRSEWEGNFGPMVTFKLRANGQEVDLNQKPETPAPTEGQEIFGHLEDGKFRPKLKKDKRPDGSSDYGSRSGGGGNFKGKSPDQQASIVRQHSQEMAIRAMALYGEWEHERDLKGAIREWTDFFEADANKAAAGSGGNQTPPASQEVTGPEANPGQSQTPDDTHQHFSHLLEQAGLNPAAAALLANYCMESHQAKVRDCITALGGDKKQAVVDWLTERYEEAHGPLPSAASGAMEPDDIPFARPEYRGLFSERERRSKRP